MFFLDHINKAGFTYVFLIRLEIDEIASSKRCHLFLMKNDFSVQFVIKLFKKPLVINSHFEKVHCLVFPTFALSLPV